MALDSDQSCSTPPREVISIVAYWKPGNDRTSIYEAPVYDILSRPFLLFNLDVTELLLRLPLSPATGKRVQHNEHKRLKRKTKIRKTKDNASQHFTESIPGQQGNISTSQRYGERMLQSRNSSMLDPRKRLMRFITKYTVGLWKINKPTRPPSHRDGPQQDIRP